MQATAHERRNNVQDIVILKCGGSTINELSKEFFDNMRKLQKSGKYPVIVHGGGPAIQHMLEQLQIEFEFVNGLRKTTEDMMDIVEMVLVGHVNPALTRRVNSAGLKGFGISGSDLHLLEATPLNYNRYGLVGEISNVHTNVINQLLEKNIIPIIAPIAIGQDGKKYNVNADTAAGAIASALGAEQLIFVTDVPGILKDEQLLEEVTTDEVEMMIQDGIIFGGMIPKVKAAMKGLTNNVREVLIVNGMESKLKNKQNLAGTTIKVPVKS